MFICYVKVYSLTEIPATLTDVSRGIPQALHINCGIILPIWPRPLHSTSSHQQSTALRCYDKKILRLCHGELDSSVSERHFGAVSTSQMLPSIRLFDRGQFVSPVLPLEVPAPWSTLPFRRVPISALLEIQW